MGHDHVIEKLKSMGLTIGYRAKVREEDGVMLYLVDDLYLYEVDMHRLAVGETTFAELRAEYGDDIYPPNPYRRAQTQSV